jgi:hypothetical protein
LNVAVHFAEKTSHEVIVFGRARRFGLCCGTGSLLVEIFADTIV